MSTHPEQALNSAADMLIAYAELIKATGRYAEEHYIPGVEYVISELRALAALTPQAPAVVKDSLTTEQPEAAEPVPAPVQPVTWQPIETAPQDGSSIYVSDGKDVVCASWVVIDFQEFRDRDGFYVGQLDGDSYWMRADDGERIEPTLWVPPPPPPAALTGKAGKE